MDWPQAVCRLPPGQFLNRQQTVHCLMQELKSPQTFAHLFRDASQLRGQGIAKWDQVADDVIPCWVADMDFMAAPEIRAAVARIAENGAFGYPLRDGQSPDKVLATIFAKRMQQKHGWTIEPDRVIAINDLVQAFYASFLAFSDEGDGVIVQVPNYPPFRAAVTTTKRRFVSLEAEDVAGRLHWRPDELSPDALDRARILVVCNPQNPSGRVLSRGELEALGAFAIKHDLIILSDEIHADLIYDGRIHTPIAMLSDAIADRTITLSSASKSYSIAGLRCAVMHFGSNALKRRFLRRIPLKLLGSPNSPGVDATIAAWTMGQDWLSDALGALTLLRAQLKDRLERDMPQLKLYLPEATYLAWIDCSALALDEPAAGFFLREAKVGLSAGETFHPERRNFIRLNFATSPAILDDILDRMRDAITARSTQSR